MDKLSSDAFNNTYYTALHVSMLTEGQAVAIDLY